METLGFVAVLLCILAAASISRRVQGTILTLPMVYAGLGFLLSERVLGMPRERTLDRDVPFRDVPRSAPST